jgi:hypothetical protein
MQRQPSNHTFVGECFLEKRDDFSVARKFLQLRSIL